MYLVSENIKYLRAKQKLSQNQLADKLLLTRNQINSYENGNAQPSIDVLKKISAFFLISIDVLVFIPLNKDTFQYITKFDIDEMLALIKDNREEFKLNELGVLNISEMFRNLQLEIDKKNKLKY